MNRGVAKGFSIGVFAPITAFVIYVGFYLEVDFDTAQNGIDSFKCFFLAIVVFIFNKTLSWDHCIAIHRRFAMGKCWAKRCFQSKTLLMVDVTVK